MISRLARVVTIGMLASIFMPGAARAQSGGALFSAIVAESGPRITRDVPFGPLVRHKLDIYQPASGAGTGPIAFFIYGGSWRDGERSTYGFVGAALAARGITTVIADYRLYPDVRFPAFVQDAALSYRWVATNLAANGGSPRPIILVGHSAGAHIAALLAFDQRYLAAVGPDVARPAALIGMAGPYSFDPTTWSSTAEVFATVRVADQARPIAFAGPHAPPTLLLHGEDDTTVKLWNTNQLAVALTSHAVRVRKVLMPGIGHIGLVTAIAKPLRWRAPVLDEIVGFIESHRQR